MPTLPELSATKLKLVKSLLHAKGRKKEEAFVAEGARLIQSAFDAKLELIGLILSSDAVENVDFSDLISLAGDNAFQLNEFSFEEISDTVNSQGVIAAFRKSREGIDLSGASTILVLDQIRDPGNMGMILRHAAAFGCEGIVLLKGCCDPFNPKALRASMGGTFLLPVERGLEVQELTQRLLIAGFSIATLKNEAEAENLYQSSLPQKLALVVGGETEGLDSNWESVAEHFAIPQREAIDSLNAGVAATIALAWRFQQSMKREN